MRAIPGKGSRYVKTELSKNMVLPGTFERCLSMMGPMWVDSMIKDQKHWFYSSWAVKSFKVAAIFWERPSMPETRMPSNCRNIWKRFCTALFWGIMTQSSTCLEPGCDSQVDMRWVSDLKTIWGALRPQGDPRGESPVGPAGSALCGENHLVSGRWCGKRRGVAVK